MVLLFRRTGRTLFQVPQLGEMEQKGLILNRDFNKRGVLFEKLRDLPLFGYPPDIIRQAPDHFHPISHA